MDDSIAEDDPGRAVFGTATRGIVDESQGGVIAYVHADLAEALRAAWAGHTATATALRQ
ncbi:hypothetical protein [Streptomyces californicus]|uniref:hypothetical protein n=1 Tax=Streptomyces californicus TaxID=67351 RepID=UPI003721ABA7